MTDDPRFQDRKAIRGSSTNTLLVAALVVLTAALLYQTWTGIKVAPSSDYTPRVVTPQGELGADEQSTISVYRSTSPSVVLIRTKGYQRFLFGVQEQELSSGTGFVWDEQGHIVTNLHVVKSVFGSRNSALEVQFADQSVVDAEVVGGVREHDIAILKVNVSSERLSPITLGTSDDLHVGQHVLAIGGPFGFEQTLSTGVIGGLNRSVSAGDGNEFLDGLIQTDAAINPGNSGGPLLDSSGRMIGVNTAIVSPTGAYAGLGFAVPVASVIASVDLVLTESTGPQKPMLGINVISPEHAAALQVPEELIARGLFIKYIDPDGPAATTNLLAARQHNFYIILGDQIASIDGEAVTTMEELQRQIQKHSPGDVVTLQVYRGNRHRREVDVVLQARKLLF